MRDVGLCAQVACTWEVMARKPGNVHRGQDFEDLSCLDFLLSAAAIAPVLSMACQHRVGRTIRDAIRATRRVTATNTNLGIVLLLAPLAAVPGEEPLREGLERVLEGLDVEDARLTYEAIRLAQPGGLGRAAEQDVGETPTASLREVMRLAAGRDLVARQYAQGYAEVFDLGLPMLTGALEEEQALEEVIQTVHLHLMAARPDTLIARKRGLAEAEEAGRRAAEVLAAGWPRQERSHRLLAELDGWLRAEGHGRNPGACADLVTACLFSALRMDLLSLPVDRPWAARAGPDAQADRG